MELNECISTRRSIRKYRSGNVSKEQIQELISAASKAPSWKNSQTARYYVTFSADFAQCLPPFNQKNTENAAAYIVTAAVNGTSGFNADGSYTTHLENGWQYYDNGLASANLCLKANELGLGTLIMGIYDEPKVRGYFNIPNEQTVVAVIAVGFADISPEMPKRKPLDEICIFKD